MRAFALSFLISLMALPVQAAELHCIGQQPRFILLLDGDTARFDYLGDGEFDLSPPLTGPLWNFTRLELQSFGGPIPIFIERRACTVMGIELAFTAEVALPAFSGQRPALACCREATAP